MIGKFNPEPPLVARETSAARGRLRVSPFSGLTDQACSIGAARRAPTEASRHS
jgi:hypothetical protein